MAFFEVAEILGLDQLGYDIKARAKFSHDHIHAQITSLTEDQRAIS